MDWEISTWDMGHGVCDGDLTWDLAGGLTDHHRCKYLEAQIPCGRTLGAKQCAKARRCAQVAVPAAGSTSWVARPGCVLQRRGYYS